ncbi:MAG: Hydrolase, alpha/beta hydrolase fold family [Candidatus Angelobacter sp.]|nr:Hydrolase, alpha/beta hydrolase fold family [Candidatus Angelobacter sp.]
MILILRKQFRLKVSLSTLLLLTALSGAAQNVHQPNQPLLSPCKLSGIAEVLQCGKLTVFENRATRTGRTLQLNIVVLPALDPNSKQEPLFDLAGGPGVASTESARLYATELMQYRQHRDVVLVDQRGTGKSNPLNCQRDSSPQSFLDEMYPIKYVTDCRDDLKKRADLSQYSTPIAVDDLDDVRAALGYDKVSLSGLSYGTRAALVYIRQHPTHVRSAVLMGIAPTNNVLPMAISRDGQRALTLLLQECEADRDCHAAFPNIQSELIDLLARLAKGPMQATYTLPGNGKTARVTIYRDPFAEKLRTQLYEADKSRSLPYIIHEAARGNFAPYLAVAIPLDRQTPDLISDGMYLSVSCAEGTRSIPADRSARLNRNSVFGNYRLAQQQRACSLWPARELPKSYQQPVTSSVPVLLISGNMDPITPPSWGADAAAHLVNNRHVVVPHHAHFPAGLSHMECLDKIILDFLARPDAKDLDARCVNEMLPPPFKLSDTANARTEFMPLSLPHSISSSKMEGSLEPLHDY